MAANLSKGFVININNIKAGFIMFARRAKQGPIRRAFLFTAICALLLTGQSAIFSPHARAADDAGYLQTISYEAFNFQWDPWGFAARNCVSFVAYMVNQAGATFHGVKFTNDWDNGAPGLDHWGNAYQWDDYAKSIGYAVDNTPAVGAVAQWNENESTQGVTAFGTGHVAYVTAVAGDGTVTVEDYNNIGGAGQFGTKSGVRKR